MAYFRSKIIHIFFLCLCLSYKTTNTELLIFKQTESGFEPLDASDNVHKKKIEEVLLKYQWPMSAGLALEPIEVRRETLNTSNDLFTPHSPYAEELFIEKKIQQVTGNTHYRVVFFPTCLYELFVLAFFVASYEKNDNALQHAVKELINRKDRGNIDISDLINNTKKPYEIRTEIYDTYKSVNLIFLANYNSAHDLINYQITRNILTVFPELRRSKDSLSFSNALKDKTTQLLEMSIRLLLKTNSTLLFFKQIRDSLNSEKTDKVIHNFIALEYEARNQNKALIARGTSAVKFNPLVGEKQSIVGSTIQTSNNSFELSYKARKITPYSISFGNSLFAGVVYDFSACVYNYLAAIDLGYGLFINKYDYIEHQNNNLFSIPPLSTLAALFSAGEYFHPRSKAAIEKKESAKTPMPLIDIIGITDNLSDPTGVIVIRRNPLRHASLFSQYLVNNGHIIQLGDQALLSKEEKEFVNKILQAQQESTKYYKAIKGMTPWWRRISKEPINDKPIPIEVKY